MASIERGVYTKTPRDLTVEDLLRTWLRDYVQMRCSEKTVESYAGLIDRHIVPQIGAIRLGALEPRHLQTMYARKTAEGLSSRTTHYLHSLMSQVLTYAVKQGMTPRNVAQFTEPPRIENKVSPTLSPEDLPHFFAVAKDTEHFALFYLMAHSGLRRGEALALKWQSVDLGLASPYLSVTQSMGKVNGKLVIKEPKTPAGKRRVALSQSLAQVLRQHREHLEALCAKLGRQLTAQDYVFCHVVDGSPYDPSTISHAFAKTLRRAGLPPMPLHGLRHSHATQLLQVGTHPRVVMERLGHHNIQVTLNRYSHAVAGLQEAAVQQLDAFLAARAVSEENVAKMSPKR